MHSAEFKRQLAGLTSDVLVCRCCVRFAVDPFGDFYGGRLKSHKEFDCESTTHVSLSLPHSWPILLVLGLIFIYVEIRPILYSLLLLLFSAVLSNEGRSGFCLLQSSFCPS